MTKTLQDAYDHVKAKLTAQGCRAVDKDGDCVYRSVIGYRCGIGWLIDDEHYKPILENLTVTQAPVYNAVIKSGWPEHPSFYQSIQEWHDYSSELDFEGLKQIALEEGLNP